jgi:hypothetical protein
MPRRHDHAESYIIIIIVRKENKVVATGGIKLSVSARPAIRTTKGIMAYRVRNNWGVVVVMNDAQVPAGLYPFLGFDWHVDPREAAFE